MHYKKYPGDPTDTLAKVYSLLGQAVDEDGGMQCALSSSFRVHFFLFSCKGPLLFPGLYCALIFGHC